MNAVLKIKVSPNAAVCLADRLREARIQALRRLLNREYTTGNRDEARRLWQEFNAAILARSPAHVEQMEKAMRNDARNECNHNPRPRNVRAGERSVAC